MKIDMGADQDALNVGISGDSTAQLQAFANVVALGGSGTDIFNQLNFLPVFGQPVQVDFETVTP